MHIVKYAPMGADVVPPDLAALSLSLVVQGEQDVSDALTFSVRIENTSDQPVTLHNPYDVLKYQLVNGEGWPITVRSPASRIKAGRFVDRSGYLDVTRIHVDGVDVASIDEELQSNSLTVPGGATYAYDFVVRALAPPEGQQGPTTFVPGTYGFSTLVSLISLVPSDPPGATMHTERVQVVVE